MRCRCRSRDNDAGLIGKAALKKRYTARKQLDKGRGNRGIFLKILICIIGFLIVWDVAGPYGLWARYRLIRQYRRLYAANQEAARRNARFASNIERFRSDPEYQERMVRARLGWIKDGEILFRFVDSVARTEGDK